MQLSDKIFIERMREERARLMELNTPGVLEITPVGNSNTKYDITVWGPAYLFTEDYGTPVLSEGPHELDLYVHRDYPFSRPYVKFKDASKRIAHVNVWAFGGIDTGMAWSPHNSLGCIIKRMMLVITFTPEAINYLSVSDSHYRDWMKEKEEEGAFPTFTWTPPTPKLIIKPC